MLKHAYTDGLSERTLRKRKELGGGEAKPCVGIGIRKSLDNIIMIGVDSDDTGGTFPKIVGPVSITATNVKKLISRPGLQMLHECLDLHSSAGIQCLGEDKGRTVAFQKIDRLT